DEKRYSVVHVKTLGDHDSFDVLIDFTTPHSCALHLDACLKASKPMVIGTTGLPATLIKQIKEASAKIPIMYAANMSIGVNLVYSLLELASRQLGKEWQVSISEIHHQYKQDAPSGTALEMGKVIETSSSVLR